MSRLREKSLSKSTELLKEKRRREQLVIYVAFHLALSKQAYSVCTQALRDVSFKRKGKKGERRDKESDTNPTTCSLFKGAKLCICLRKPFLHTQNRRAQEKSVMEEGARSFEAR